MSEQEKLECKISKVRFHNEDNGWTVAVCLAKGYLEEVTIVGIIPGARIDMMLEVEGTWKEHPKYGTQLEVSSCMEQVPVTAAGIEEYLASGLIKGIGPHYARQIVDCFGADALDVIESEPDRLYEVPGIGDKRVERIKKSWAEQSQIRNIMMTLQGYGISTSYASKIYKTYGNESLYILQNDPYRLADDVWGVAFKTADDIAEKLGIEKNSFIRLRSGIKYTLAQFSESGHCYAEKNELLKAAEELLEVEDNELVMTLDDLIRTKDVINEEARIYLPRYYYAEVGASNNLKRILNGNKKKIDIENCMKETEKSLSIFYDDIQKQAIKEALENKVYYITGGPGTGKTTTTNAIINCFLLAGLDVYLAAPTGRAAKRLSEVTGEPAQTIHRLLEVGGDGKFKRNEDNPLQGDVLIVDECSMIDISLMNALVKAIPSYMSLILVGDVDQLPSVGAGCVLKDIIDSNIIPGIKLEHIFRQAEGSRIITNAHKINEGEMPDMSNGNNTNYFFINAEEDDELTAKKLVNYCVQNLPSYYHVDPIKDIQVLSPMKKGPCGVKHLNQLLQNELNSSGDYVQKGGIEFRKNDKVIQMRNDYDKYVFNGDIGFVVEVDTEDQDIFVNFDDGQGPILYEKEDLDELSLAYATTIHKAQGSEHKIVVMPLVNSQYIMLNRNLLYTGVTRAKEVFVMIGSKKAVGIAMNRSDAQKRHTTLDLRLQETS